MSSKFPIVYEVNTRVWLAELSRKAGKRVTLADVPVETLDEWAAQGFHAVWLMGVWQTGLKGREIARAHPDVVADCVRALPDATPEDIVSSPFAVAAYRVSVALGGDDALATLRTRMAERGLRLMLDFVPNHTAVDHHWVQSEPGCYISIPEDKLASFDPHGYQTVAPGTHFACGRDPHFPPWRDTLQLNFAHERLHHCLIETLQKVAGQCDGVRCDMAMLMLPDVFERTWGWIAGPMPGPFWDRAITEVKRAFPEFLFIAEAYWDTEWQLQQLGFDFAYDKRLYDRSHRADVDGVRAHLRADPGFLGRLVHFTENHDEARATEKFGRNNQAATLLALGLCGLRLVNEGQTTGCKIRIPVQLIRRPSEPVDKDTAAFFRRLLPLLGAPAFSSGDFRPLEPRGSGAGAAIVFERCEGASRALTLVNLTAKDAAFDLATDFFDGRAFDRLKVLSTDPREHLDIGFLPGNVSFGLKPHEGLLFVVGG